MATAHYPETVERIFVVGAPFFFPTIWGLVTRWFDPATTSKIMVLPAGSVTSTMTQFIEKEDLPIRFGGTLEWEMGDQPKPDNETKKMIGSLANGWVNGPLRYVEKEGGDVILAVGSEEGKARREILAKLLGKETHEGEEGVDGVGDGELPNGSDENGLTK